MFELPSGLRVLFRPITHTRLVHCAVVIDVGSRDEQPGQVGMAHFIEHMIFKGTRKRRAFHILSRIDSVGGELNAFTTKEKTVYHATVTRDHTSRATELLQDITFHSTFPAREIEKEKGVIAEEIDMYRDDPEEAIFEDFDGMVFPAHPLGFPITGGKEDIAQFGTGSLLDFFRNNYVPQRTVFAITGDLTPNQVKRLAERQFAELTANTDRPARVAPAPYQVQHLTAEKPISQAHVVLGGRGYPLHHEHHIAASLLMNLLGGPSSNSRLNLNIRERYGLAYNVQTFYQPYVDSGLWGVYAGTESRNLGRVLRLVEGELTNLRSKPLSTAALAKAQKQFLGQLIIGQESPFAMLMAQAKDVLDFERVTPLDEVVRQVEALTAIQLQGVAQELFAPDQLSCLRFVPEA